MRRLAGHLHSLLRAYSRHLELKPVLTKACTAAFIFSAGDLAAQLCDGPDAIDWPRLLTGALVGLCYFGPAAHAWYAAVQRLFPRSTFKSVLTKTALGQLCFGPVFIVVYFAAALVAANGLSGLAELPSKVSKDLLPTIVAGLGFWPLVDVFSFAVIARRKDGEVWLPLFVNACSFVWQVYLSLQSRTRQGSAEVIVSQSLGRGL